MDLNTITVADFKAQFPRNFPYLSAITYDPSAIYNAGVEVYYPTSLLFYTCQIDGTTGVAPTSVTDPVTWVKKIDDVLNYVSDQDIQNAFAEAQIVFNQALFGTDAEIKLGYLYLTAHFLCNDLLAAQSGIAGTGAMPVTGRTVGSVSESYGIPQVYLDNPIYAFYITSRYGLKFLSMALPGMVGNMFAVCARTNP